MNCYGAFAQEDRRYRRYLYEVCDRLTRVLSEKGSFLCAVDGRCGSGKTSFAGCVAAELSAEIIHADDFYLRPEQRTPERYAEPGGNLDRERLISEVLLPLSEGRPFSYRVFDPRVMAFGETKRIEDPSRVIIEGSYSCHPAMRDRYDLTVFCDVAPDEQMRRIRLRNGEEKALQFRDRWIPLEERYFAGRRTCDITLDM